MNQFPLIATLKQGCVVLNNDMSYSTHIRKPNTSVLKQNNTDLYTKTMKLLKKVEDITVKYDSIADYAKAHQVLHEAHTKENAKNDVTIKPLGLLSQTQIRKMRKAIENMCSTVLLNYDYNKEPWENENYLAFVTLTLPYKQMHTDAIIRKALISFIDNLRKTYKVKYYVWKAEAQENGNIHFHLIIDKFIDYTAIKTLWNRQLNKLGYIDKYSEKRKNEGFIYKEWYFKKGKRIKAKKSFYEQKMAYEAEKLMNFQQPNSTDIHSLQNVKNPSRYIMKYMEKQEEGKRPIIGKIWGLSNETKRLDYPKINESEPLFRQVIHMISNSDLKVVLKDDFFSVHAGRIHDIVKKKYKAIWGAVKKHYKTIINQIEKPIEMIKEVVEEITTGEPPKPKTLQNPQLSLYFQRYETGGFK